MSVMEVTSMSTKGQVVIPTAIRRELGLEPGRKLAIITDGANVLLRPIDPPKVSAFESLLAETRSWARKAGLKPSDVTAAIRKVRRARRARPAEGRIVRVAREHRPVDRSRQLRVSERRRPVPAVIGVDMSCQGTCR